MSEESQIDVPPSFIALYLAPGRLKPSAPKAHIAERHDYCEDLATLLTETARTMLFNLGITEADVIERCERGLLAGEAPSVSPAEARWVVRRLAELLGWDDPGPSDDPAR